MSETTPLPRVETETFEALDAAAALAYAYAELELLRIQLDIAQPLDVDEESPMLRDLSPMGRRHILT